MAAGALKDWDGRFNFSKVEPGCAGEKGVVTRAGDFVPIFQELLSKNTDISLLPERKPGMSHNLIHAELSHKSRRSQRNREESE